MPEPPLDAGLPRETARRCIATAFRAAGLEQPDLDARILLCAALDIDHATLVRDPLLPLGDAGAARLSGLVARRLAREPVSRIIGHREFWGLRFAISPAVLDPRPETEILVEGVLARLGPRRGASLRLIDLGVGSGAILGALLHELPHAFGLGLDRSFDACRLAQRNLTGLGFGTRAAVACANWSTPLSGQFDVIVSNPPYIASSDVPDLAPEVRDHDPRLALDGGGDGLAPYRHLIPVLPALLARDGWLAFECGAGQAPAIAGLMTDAGLSDIARLPDLAGHDRVVIGQAIA